MAYTAESLIGTIARMTPTNDATDAIETLNRLILEAREIVQADEEEDDDRDCACCDEELEQGNGDNWGNLCPGCADKVSEYMDAANVDEDRAIDFIKEHPDWDGSLQCHTCGTQTDQDGICPVCKVLEEAQMQLVAVMGQLPPETWIAAYTARLAALTPEEEGRRKTAHAAIEAALSQPIESCRKCGAALTLEDVDGDGNACTDVGAGDEAGKVFVYCSAACRDQH